MQQTLTDEIKAARKLKRSAETGLKIAYRYDIYQMEQFDKWYDRAYLALYSSRKYCRLCQELFPLEEFAKSRSNIDGRKHECKKCSHKRYVTPHLKKINERVKTWFRNNPEKAKQIRRKQARKPINRIKGSLSRRIKNLLGSKSERTHELIGCSPKYLSQHLEARFTPDMTWDNYGTTWHVDHRIPCRAFNLALKEERLKCFHYTNLQPLLAGENTSKGDTLPDGRKAREVFNWA